MSTIFPNSKGDNIPAGDKPIFLSNIGATEQLAGKALSSAHIVHFRRKTVLSLADGGFTVIPLDDVFYDTSGMADISSGKVVCLRAGWYNCTISGVLKNPTGPIGRVVIRATLLRFDDFYLGDVMWSEVNGLTGYTNIAQTIPIYLNVGDKLVLAMFQNSGGSVQIEESADYQRAFIALSEIAPHELPAMVPLISRQVVGMGDSQTEGNIIGGPGLVWGEWLSSDFVNHGHSGASTDTLISTYTGEITGSANINADFVLEIGTNDIGYNVSFDASDCADNIEALLDIARPLYRSITWIPPGPSAYSAYANSAGYEVDRQALIAEVISRGITGLNIARTDLDPDIGPAAAATNRIWFTDYLHWSPLTQKRVAEIVAETLP